MTSDRITRRRNGKIPIWKNYFKFNRAFFRAVFKFDGPRIVCSATGSDFEKFKDQFEEKERAFGYIRIQTGDEMSKRQKFLFVTFVGSAVSVIQRAKMSTDKSVIKNVISVSIYNIQN